MFSNPTYLTKTETFLQITKYPRRANTKIRDDNNFETEQSKYTLITWIILLHNLIYYRTVQPTDRDNNQNRVHAKVF